MLREPFCGQRAIHSVSTDNDIIRRSRDSPAAFGELYDRHASVIYRYAARRAGDFAADDVTSETFLVAWEQLGTYDLDREDARPWLFGIATNLLRRHHRAEAKVLKAAAKAASDEAVADDSDRIADRVDAKVATGRLARTLKGMTAVDRETLLLYAWADLTYEGIALAMQVPVGTVRSRLNRARRAMRAQLNLEQLDETENDHGRFAAAPRNA
ncbi:RNA polymerase sigma factor [Arthrobacter pigmenti]|uniref:RNA polymerase sigma factor n=1 Tax=Arthrobacter pigmenti TaxID=271432 RepID=UPI00143AF06C|nr:RNA polymerase sigma factor [Arthrobacter pigmenti]